jgi:hypothetical protein
VPTDATKLDLVDVALANGHPVSPRLIDDWVALGLLDQPTKRGLGRGMGIRATWAPNQVQLFVRLLVARETAHRVKTLCNLPVWLWLTCGDEYVPLRQAKRAMETWVHGSATTAWGHARAAAKAASEGLPASVATRARSRVAQLLAEALYRGRLDEVSLARVLGDAPGAADHLRVLSARFDAVKRIAAIDDDAYLEARAFYGSLTPPLRPGDPDLQELASNACLDLVTLLGFGLRNASPTAT